MQQCAPIASRLKRPSHSAPKGSKEMPGKQKEKAKSTGPSLDQQFQSLLGGVLGDMKAREAALVEEASRDSSSSAGAGAAKEAETLVQMVNVHKTHLVSMLAPRFAKCGVI